MTYMLTIISVLEMFYTNNSTKQQQPHYRQDKLKPNSVD